MNSSGPGANTTLSLSARLGIFLGPPALVCATVYISPRTGSLSLLAFLPSIWGWHRYNKDVQTHSSEHADLEPLTWTYLLSAAAGLPAVAAIQCIAGYGISTLLYGTGEARERFLKEAMRATTDSLDADTILYRAGMSQSWRYRAFLTLFFFSAAGFGEELLKLCPVLYGGKKAAREERKVRKWGYLNYALSSSLAFGAVEGIGFFYTACVAGHETGSKLALTVFERLAIGSSGHVLMAMLSALRATRKDYGGDKKMRWWRVIAPSALIHGAFDVAALLFSAYEGNVGWIHPEGPATTAAALVTASMFWVGTAWLVKREFALLGDDQQKDE